MRFKRFLSEAPYSSSFFKELRKEFIELTNDKYFFDFGVECLGNPKAKDKYDNPIPLTYDQQILRKKCPTVAEYKDNGKVDNMIVHLNPKEFYPFWNRKTNQLQIIEKGNDYKYLLRPARNQKEIDFCEEIRIVITYKYEIQDGNMEPETVKQIKEATIDTQL